MSLLRKFHRFLGRFRFLQESAHFLEDASKYSMVFGQIYLSVTNMWPANLTNCKISKVLFFIVIGITILHLVSILMYCYSYAKNVDTIVGVFQQAHLGLQVLYKMVVIFNKSNQLSNLIHIVWFEFWPSNLFGEDLERQIANRSKVVIIPILLELIIAGAYSIICLFLPILTLKSSVLLHEAWYPLGWNRNFMSKSTHIFKSFVAIYADLGIICAYDLLYVVLCVNCSAQFQLVCGALELIGSGKDRDAINNIQAYRKDTKKSSSYHKEERNEFELLSICVQHHRRLIQFANELNAIFGSGHFLQMCNTLTGICLTSYVISSADSFIYVTFNIIYYAAHFWQLYVLCAASTQISDASACVFDAAYYSKWYSRNYPNITQCLIIIMTRSLTPITMNAFGLIVLNHELFLTVMRFSFTLYTFLRTITA